MSKLYKMNAYLSDLAVMNIKLHNLHWNVTGLNFMATHEFTEGLYDDLFIKLDDVAEQIKVLGEIPLSRLSDYIANSSIEELEGRDFSTKEVIDILLDDLKKLRNDAFTIREIANEEDDFATVAMFEEHVASYDKNLWFLRSMSK